MPRGVPNVRVTERRYEQRFCSRLRELRVLRGLSQQKLADLTGLAQSMISKMESGVGGVSLDHALALCDVLRVDLFEMIGEGEVQVVTIR